MAIKGIPKRSDHRHNIGDIDGLQSLLMNSASKDGHARTEHTHTMNQISGLEAALSGYVLASALNELIDDRVAALLTAGSNTEITYNDAGNQLTVTASGGGGNSYFPQGW